MTLAEVLLQLRALDKYIVELRLGHDAAVVAISEAQGRRDGLIRAALGLVCAEVPLDAQLALRLEGDYASPIA